MPLSAPAISANRIEETLSKLLQEWLARYFDGATHGVGGETLTFPAAQVRFQSRPVDQPLAAVAITVTWVTPAVIRRCWENVDGEMQEMVTARISFDFWLRASGQFADGTNPRYQALQLGDRLYSVLANSAETMDLSAKGIHRWRVRPAQLVAVGPGTPGENNAYEMRLITAVAALRYPVITQ
jgi:hypothetical protein